MPQKSLDNPQRRRQIEQLVHNEFPNCQVADGLLARNRVRVSIERQPGGLESFEVSSRDPDAFVRALEAIRRAE